MGNKRKSSALMLTLFFLFIACFALPLNASTWSTATSSTWIVSTVDSRSYDPSLALDSNGQPYVSYQDLGSENFDLKYAFWDGKSWVTTVVDSTYYAGYNPSLKLDGHNQPLISYGVRWIHGFDSTHFNMETDYVKIAVLEGNSWKIRTVGDAVSSVMKLDSNNQPHICYSTGDSLRYTFWNGNSWINETLVTKDHVGQYLSLALDTNDQPHICYFEYKNTENFTDGSLKYSWFSGTEWQTTTVDNEVDGLDINLVLDRSNQPHISYSNKYAPYSLNYAILEDGLWRITKIDPTTLVGTFSSLALDNNDQPHIVYCDITNNTYDTSLGMLKYAWLSRTVWKTTAIDSGFGDFSLTLDKNNRPHVSYINPQSHDLKYAVLSTTSLTPTPPVPEFSWIAILSLFAALVTATALVLKLRQVKKR
jgi:hypothetical protein